MTTDLQHVAQVLAKTQRGDQVTRAEQDRLDEIAAKGHSTVTPSRSMDLAPHEQADIQ